MFVNNYLTSVTKQLRYYKHLGDQTFNQLSEDDLLKEIEVDANSIAIIVNHMVGNMKSRWTDFLTSDGEKTWRNRDVAFENGIKSKADLLSKWEEGWECVFNALETINEENFDSIIYIRNQGHTITEAINRQLCHYSYHIGQIVYLGKLHIGNAWNSLSIPKNQSEAYNANRFNKGKEMKHFTDDI